ncbi:hypothetical protein TRFO_18539 [Tritrichomonas foetus]|uniref:Proteasome assembly chaperone 2 n=1 Tax=Tritrichomonas foetus TaxID=1144522 RepID=A0A1J4KKM4_9EUKA|nr:hypothetical protein TRFO_18539 [Tritrichomonas foetus]|eukprot:OHT11857.1 hypothetical protein TRFO_18539 [Tritrichomonas foetus]
MKWISIEGSEQPNFKDYSLILPSCGAASGDQLTIDVICATFGKLVGRILSDNLDFVASPDPFNENSNHIASSIDAYTCDLPKFGQTLVLRVASNLPSSKRKILDYSKEIVEFTEVAGITQILLIRSVSSVFCNDAQIHGWPRTIRAWGPLTDKLGEKPLESYDETQEMISAAVYGELCECLKRFAKIPFSVLFVFIHEGAIMENVVTAAKTVAGTDQLKVPASWEKLFSPGL